MTDKRYAGLMVTESILVKVKATAHLQKILLREKKGFHNVLFKRVGAGLTAQQFEGLVQALVELDFCTCTVGERGAVTLALTEGNDEGN